MEQTFKLRKSKKFKNLCAVALLSVALGGPILQIHAQETNAQAVTSGAVDKNNPVYTEIPGEKTERIVIRTQQDLDNAIKRKGSNLSYGGLTFENTENLVFPAGVYKFAGNTKWAFPEASKGNIDFSKAVFALDNKTEFIWTYNGDHSTNGKNQEISGVTVFGTPDSFVIGQDRKKTEDVNYMRNSLMNAQHITFKDWTANATSKYGPLFNIEGSQNITIDNLTAQGVGNKAFTKEEREAFNSAKDSDTSMATAIKIANVDKFDSNQTEKPEWKGLFVKPKTDQLQSENITITNSTFKGYEGKTGHSIIDNADDKISLPFSGNIKSEKSSLAYKNIVISNNKLDHTIDFGDKQKASVDPIALYLGGKTTARDDIKVTGNQITNYEGPKTGLGTIKEDGNYITWTVSDEVQKPAETPKPVEPPKVETPKPVEPPKVETPKVEEPKAEEPKVETPKVEEPKVETPKVETPKVEEPKVEEPKAEEPKAEEPKVEEPKVETPKTEEPKAEVKPEVKPDVKPETKPSKLEQKSEPKSDFTTAQTPSQTPAKQELPKTNDIKTPLTISGIVLATAGLVALGYRKFFGKN